MTAFHEGVPRSRLLLVLLVLFGLAGPGVAGELPYDHARIYPSSTDEVWAAIDKISGKLRFESETRTSELLILERASLRYLNKNAPRAPDGKHREFSLYVFVAGDGTPARVYVNSELRDGRQALYNTGEVEQAFYERLESTLGVEGLAIPDTFEQRMKQRVELGEAVDCHERLADSSSVPNRFDDPASVARPLAESQVAPLLSRDGTSALVLSDVSEDGVVLSSHTLRIDPNNPGWIDTIETTVGIWRFEPAVVDGCPVPARVAVQFGEVDYPIAEVESPIPFPDNPRPKPADAMLASGLDARLDFSVRVGEGGSVESAELDGISPSNATTPDKALELVERWKFWPALKNGLPVAADHEFSIEVSPNFDYARARFYSASSAEVWEAAVAAARALGFEVQQEAPDTGRLVTKNVAFDPITRPPALDDGDLFPLGYQLYVFIPRFRDRGRVYVDTRLWARSMKTDRNVARVYRGDLSKRFLDGLDTLLGQRGRPVPLKLERRQLLGESLGEPTGACQQPKGPLIAGVGGVTNPRRVMESYVKPIYPPLAAFARLTGKVYLQAIVTEDGLVDDVTLLRSTEPELGFEEAAISAVSLWSYLPATWDDCIVPVYFTINVDFTM